MKIQMTITFITATLFLLHSCAEVVPVPPVVLPEGEEHEDPSPAASTGDIQVWTYPDVISETQYGYLKRSEIYEVRVSNGNDSAEIYVMADRNSFQLTDPNSGQGKKMTRHNHYGSFSFKGKVEIHIRRKDRGSLEGLKVYPLDKKYDYTIQGDSVIINLDSWAYLYVDTPDLHKEPLFIFADPAEDSVPRKSMSEVLNPGMDAATIRNRILNTPQKTIYFEPGVYDFGNDTSRDYPGYQLPIVSNKDYYIPGGAVIIGSFYNGGNVSDTKFYGRGIITGCGKERLPNAESIPYSLFYTGSGTGNSIEGLHFFAPPHFCVLSRGELDTRYAKMCGWYHQTDGWGGGSNSTIADSFIKVNDDFVKLYNQNQKVNNVVMYKQINGAAIQLGWNAAGSARGCTVEDIYIVDEDNKTPSGICNTAVINLMNNGNSNISDILFKNIHMDNKVQFFLGLNGHGGSISNLTFESIQESKGAYNAKNYIATQQDNNSVFNNFRFVDYRINGKKVTCAADMNLQQYMAEGTTILKTDCNLITPTFE